MKTYKDVYEFPLEDFGGCGYINDQKDNFVFQFTFNNEFRQNRLLDVINGVTKFKNTELVFKHEEGYIVDNLGQKLILIRGWGNLTGVGGMNLSGEEASNIQNTFANYIVEQLNDRS